MALPQAASNAAPSEFRDEPLSNIDDPKVKNLAPIAFMQDLCRTREQSARDGRDALRQMSNAEARMCDAVPANVSTPGEVSLKNRADLPINTLNVLTGPPARRVK
jgi:hypothetical protein